MYAARIAVSVNRPAGSLSNAKSPASFVIALRLCVPPSLILTITRASGAGPAVAETTRPLIDAVPLGMGVRGSPPGAPSP